MKRKSFLKDNTGNKGIIFNIQRFSINDGPGIRTTVFLKGCPLRCLWCHNPEGKKMSPQIAWYEQRCVRCLKCKEACPVGAITLEKGRIVTNENLCELCGKCIDVCPNDAREIVGKSMSVDEVFAEVKEDKIFYERSGGGVTCSGGEPLMQFEFVSNLFKKCKENKINTALDTSGYGEWKAFERILPFTDLILYDLKQMDPSKHISYTGVEPYKIWENLKNISKIGIPIWIRCPVVLGYTDDEKNFREIAKFVSKLTSVKRIELLPYHRLGEPKYKMLNEKYLKLESPSTEVMNSLDKIVKFINDK